MRWSSLKSPNSTIDYAIESCLENSQKFSSYVDGMFKTVANFIKFEEEIRADRMEALNGNKISLFVVTLFVNFEVDSIFNGRLQGSLNDVDKRDYADSIIINFISFELEIAVKVSEIIFIGGVRLESTNILEITSLKIDNYRKVVNEVNLKKNATFAAERANFVVVEGDLVKNSFDSFNQVYVLIDNFLRILMP